MQMTTTTWFLKSLYGVVLMVASQKHRKLRWNSSYVIGFTQNIYSVGCCMMLSTLQDIVVPLERWAINLVQTVIVPLVPLGSFFEWVLFSRNRLVCLFTTIHGTLMHSNHLEKYCVAGRGGWISAEFLRIGTVWTPGIAKYQWCYTVYWLAYIHNAVQTCKICVASNGSLSCPLCFLVLSISTLGNPFLSFVFMSVTWSFTSPYSLCIMLVSSCCINPASLNFFTNWSTSCCSLNQTYKHKLVHTIE